MNSIVLFFHILIAVITSANGAAVYKLRMSPIGAIQAEVDITDETGNWTVELKFDDKVTLRIMTGGTIKSASADEKDYVISGEPLKGEALSVAFVAKYDNNAGANLISASFNGKPIDIGVIPTSWPVTIAPIGEKGNYNYSNAIHASLLFYEAQRSGKLPKDNRIHWRGDSMLDDGKDVGHDLTGGYFDAGDLVKFGFPMAYTVTVLSWGVIDYEDVYEKVGELENVRNAIKWGTDYFIKCHTSDDEYYGQVGDGNIDHMVWGRPEDWPKDKARPAFKVTSAHGGSDLVGETSAALAAASIVFKKSDPKYSETLLNHSKSLYTFADKHRDTFTTEISNAIDFYKSWSGFGDELAWAAVWLLRATNDSTYKAETDKHFKEFTKQLDGRPGKFDWDDKTAGVQVLAAQVIKDEKYKTLTKTFCDFIVNNATRSPKEMTRDVMQGKSVCVKSGSSSMVYLDQWGTLRLASNAAFICLQAANLGINEQEYRKFAEGQIGYILGDTGRSFVVGVGVNPPSHEHHRASSCPSPPVSCADGYINPGPNPHTLTGAIIGGPDANDTYVDAREDYVHNEVALDYNAGYQGALAALQHLKNK